MTPVTEWCIGRLGRAHVPWPLETSSFKYETPDGTDLPACDPAKYIVDEASPFAALEEKVKIQIDSDGAPGVAEGPSCQEGRPGRTARSESWAV